MVNTLKLKIALTKKRRKWFVGLWDYPIALVGFSYVGFMMLRSFSDAFSAG